MSPSRIAPGNWVTATTEPKSNRWGRSFRRHRLQSVVSQFVTQFNAPQETEASEAASDRDENTSGTSTPIYSGKILPQQRENWILSFQRLAGVRIATDTFVPRLVTFGSFRGPAVPLGTDQSLAPLAGNSNTYPGIAMSWQGLPGTLDVSQSWSYFPPRVSTFLPGGQLGFTLGASLFTSDFFPEIFLIFSPKTNSNRAALFKLSLCFSIFARTKILSLNPPRAPC